MENKSALPTRPSRIILNFGHRCNMSCTWCYVPFGGPAPTLDTCLQIIDRCASIGMSVITFGGGDPFQYRFLGSLARKAKDLGLIIHVDTNAIALSPSDLNLRLIDETIDLLGLPLDGPNEEIHGTMRSDPRHFGLLMDRLAWLGSFRSKIKLNTVLTQLNAPHLGALAKLVNSIGPARWSVYQYWPLADGARSKALHGISDDDFVAATVQLSNPSPVQIEVNALSSRRLTYPFVSHDGRLYVHSSASLSDYEDLGSIFEDAPVAELFHRCGAERPQAASRHPNRK